VRQDERRGIFVDTLHVHEMHLQATHFRVELRQSIEVPLAGAPVEVVSPMVGDAPQYCGRDAIGPGSVARLIGPPGAGQPLFQIDERRLVDID